MFETVERNLQNHHQY